MRWTEAAKQLQREVYALHLAMRDPRVPWYGKALAGAIVAYALSPIDLIPDFIPILGYIDDLVLIPMGVLLVRRLIPAPVLADCRAQAAALSAKPKSWVGAAIVLSLWVALAGLAVLLTWRWFNWPSS